MAAADGLDPGEVTRLVAVGHEAQTLPTASGTPMNHEQIQAIRESVVDVAGNYGFPGPRNERTTAGFDADCALAIHGVLPLDLHAAADRGAWTFLTCVVLLDVAVWRFPGRNVQRFVGDPNRNVFRRLWMRREILGAPEGDADPVWSREDILVQIMERPAASESPELARGVCEVIRNRWSGVPGPVREELVRNFMLRVLRRLGLSRMELLGENRRLEILAGIAADAESATGVEAQQETQVHREQSGSERLEPVPLRAQGMDGSLDTLTMDEMTRSVFEALEGLPDGYGPEDLRAAVCQPGLEGNARHEKLLVSIANALIAKGEVELVGDTADSAAWKKSSGASGSLGRPVAVTLDQMRAAARDLGLDETGQEARTKLAGAVGIEGRIPKYLKRALNLAISSPKDNR